MEEHVVMTCVSLRNHMELSMCEALTIMRCPTHPSSPPAEWCMHSLVKLSQSCISMLTEMEQLDDCQTFHDIGKRNLAPHGCEKIKVHLACAVKHDGRHKARCVADGHFTDIPVDSVCSGVVTLRGSRMMLFLVELNGLDTWATDIGNACLEAHASEKVVIIAGPEFGSKREGNMLIIVKALHGLRSSGKCFHDKFCDDLIDMGFKPCKNEPDIWMRKNMTTHARSDCQFHEQKGPASRRNTGKVAMKIMATNDMCFVAKCGKLRGV